MPEGLWKPVPGSCNRCGGVLNPSFDFADPGQILVELPLIRLGDAIADAVGVVQYIIDHAPPIKVTIGDGGLCQAVGPLGKQAIKDHFGIHLVWGR